MATLRNPLQRTPARGTRQVPNQDDEVLDLDIEELEERIAPLYSRRPPLN
jgi:hypothetical protein